MDNSDDAKKHESNCTSETMRSPPEKPACDERLRQQTDEAGMSEVSNSHVSQLSPTNRASVPDSPAVSNVRTDPRDNQAITDSVEPRPSADCHHVGNTIESPAKEPVEPSGVSDLRRSIQQLAARERRSSSFANFLDTSSVSLASPSCTESSLTSTAAVTIPSFLAKILPPTAEQSTLASPVDQLSAQHRERRQPRLTAGAPDISPREFSAASTTPSKLTDLHWLPASAEEQRSNVRAYIVTMLVVLALCALLVALLLIAVPSDSLRPVCASSSCAALEALLAESVDQTREPCSNFYAYVCHGWGHSQNLSVYHSHVRRFLEEVGELLTAWPEARTADRAAVALYQACASVLVRGAEELAAFRDQLRLCGVSWPGLSAHPDVVLTAARVYDNFRVAALLRVRALSRSGASDLLEVSPDEGFLLAWQRTRGLLLRDGVYERLFEETKSIYVGDGGLAEELLPYGQFLDLESSILADLVHEERHPHARNATFVGTVDTLATVTKNIGGKPWRTTAKKLGLSNSARVLVTDLDYLTAVDQLLRVWDKQRLHYYVGWCVMQQMGRYIDEAFASAWYKYEAASKAVSDSSERRAQAYCVLLVENLVGPLAFRRFALVNGDIDWSFVSSTTAAITVQLVKKVTGNRDMQYLPPADLNIASSLAHVGNGSSHEEALMALDKTLEKWEITNNSSLLNNWMYVATAVNKVDASLGDQIRTAHVRNLLQNQWYDLLDDLSGTVSLQPLLATLPVYKRNLNDAAKYGTVGTLVATALLRVLLAKFAGNAPVREEVAHKLRCFAQSAQFQRDELEIFHTAASVDIALDALRSMRSTDRQRLHMFDELQTFFVLVCYLLCTPHASKNVEAAEAGCNEAVKNSANFQAAFNCAPGSPMNPETKCSFF
ncbi:endothelin-converting enzyme 1-like [Dermacentor albipictus]|uniref:endothelin-converting enzyme 1-like n=1 Tax=Dermacentor albipictus TaxID=60249 RepID=UPI0038FC717F